MKLKKLMTIAAALSAISFSATAVHAENLAMTNLSTLAGTTVTDCAVCHTDSTGAGGSRNAFGDAFKNAGGAKVAYNLTAAAWTTLAAADSDGDGTDNNTEIQAGTNPGVNPTSTTTSSSGGGGCVTASVTTPLMMVLAMLSLGFFVRRKKG